MVGLRAAGLLPLIGDFVSFDAKVKATASKKECQPKRRIDTEGRTACGQANTAKRNSDQHASNYSKCSETDRARPLLYYCAKHL